MVCGTIHECSIHSGRPKSCPAGGGRERASIKQPSFIVGKLPPNIFMTYVINKIRWWLSMPGREHFRDDAHWQIAMDRWRKREPRK